MEDRNKVVQTEIKYMQKEGFTPSPEAILTDICSDSSLEIYFAVIHGSYVYKQEIPMATYIDTRVFTMEGKFVESRFELVVQPPDVDVLICVNDRPKFELNFRKYIEDFGLSSLPYFFTLNLIDLSVFNIEISKTTPVALKTILAFRPLIVFGDSSMCLALTEAANFNLVAEDVEFQNQYDARKDLYYQMIQLGKTTFTLTRKNYEEDYPLLLASYEGRLDALFPKDRTKLVYPRTMGIKRKLILGEHSPLELE